MMKIRHRHHTKSISKEDEDISLLNTSAKNNETHRKKSSHLMTTGLIIIIMLVGTFTVDFMGLIDNLGSIIADMTNKSEPHYFQLQSGNRALNRAYNLALKEVSENIVNGYFIAGSGWAQLWTRDTAYAVELGAGLVHPKEAKKAIEKSTEYVDGIGQVWLQDECGHFGGWPNLSDAIVGVVGSWALYRMTGDIPFLEWSYQVTKNSLLRAERDVLEISSGLFKGCSSFMESNSGYPSKYKKNGDLVGMTKALSTNILHYNGYILGYHMGVQLKAPEDELNELYLKALNLKKSIKKIMWLKKQGYYSYFQDENGDLSTQMEGLGESLALLSPDFETDIAHIESIFTKTHKTKLGIPCLWPQNEIVEVEKDDASYYHNGRIWPFVQGYWAMAAARHQMVDIYEDEVRKMIKLSKRGNTFAEFYNLDGTFLKSRRRQLWSDSGFLSTVFYGLFGMNFLPDGIEFKPIKPKFLVGKKISLTHVRYREMELDIIVTGYGYKILSFQLDDESSDNKRPFVPGTLTGSHTVKITLE